ncbi:MAG: hypothetical protein ACLFQX_05090 [Candidatus Kapaibacterium sp.]
MNVDSVNNSNSVYGAQSQSRVSGKNDQDAAASRDDKAVRRGDTLELSAEAKRLQPIRNRVESGFYNRPEVIREAASRISSQFPPETQAAD